MSEDLTALQEKVRAMMGGVGRKTRYRLLEMHKRLDEMIKDQAPRKDESSPQPPDHARSAA